MGKESTHTTAGHGTNSGDAFAFQVQPDQVDWFWPQILPLIEKWIPCADGAYTADDIRSYAKFGVIQLFIFHTHEEIKLVCMTEIVQYPRIRAVRLIGMTGSRPRIILQFLPAFEQWAKANGAVRLESLVERRVERLMGRIGLAPRYTFMTKSLGN